MVMEGITYFIFKISHLILVVSQLKNNGLKFDIFQYVNQAPGFDVLNVVKPYSCVFVNY